MTFVGTNVSLKWVLIVACPMAITIIYLLCQKSVLDFVYYKSRTIMQRLETQTDRQRDLIFIGHSNVEINQSMNSDEADIAFFKFISKLHFVCGNSKRFGNVLDGGWDICLAEPFRPKQPCVVYSFGINNDFSFDDAVSNSFNCTVRCFDPSMTKNSHQRSANVWFYKIGIGGENAVNSRNWTLKTLNTLIASFNKTDKIIDYLKMDVESSEWSSLGQMLANKTMSKVKQLGIEIHVSSTDAKTLYKNYVLLKRLEDAGFRRWYFARNYYGIRKTKNGFRSCCYEMVYINTRFL